MDKMKRMNVILSTVVVALASVAVLVHTVIPHVHHDDNVEIVSLLSLTVPCEDDHHHHHHDDCTFGSTMLLSMTNDNHRNHHIAFAPNKRLTKAFDLSAATLPTAIAVPLRVDNFVATLPVGKVPKIAPAHRRSTSTRAPPIC
ncbi:MAG: hypothetical protein ACI31D_03630 [Candidatus Limisoma sp.]